MGREDIFSKIITTVFVHSADGNYEVRYKSNVLIRPNGELLWIPPAIYQVCVVIGVDNISLNTNTQSSAFQGNKILNQIKRIPRKY